MPKKEVDDVQRMRKMDLELEILLLKKEILELKYGTNSDRLLLRYNENHDPDNGQFTSGPGGGSGSAEAAESSGSTEAAESSGSTEPESSGKSESAGSSESAKPATDSKGESGESSENTEAADGGSESAEAAESSSDSLHVDSSADADKSTGKPQISISDKQFGTKAGKHAHEFGLDVHTEEGREKLHSIIKDINDNPDEVRVGQWHRYGEILFYIKGEDVVLATKSGDFITILKGGVTNARVENARIRKE